MEEKEQQAEQTKTGLPAEKAENQPAAGDVAERPDAADMRVARLREEYPEAEAKGPAGLPEDIARMCGEEGMSLLEGYRLADLRRTRARCEDLAGRCRAQEENRRNARASTGSLAGGDAVERDYCGPREWDRLPAALRRKFIRNGKVFEFMKQWGKNG